MYQTKTKAYEGNDNYIFVSYAHKDSDFVLPFIDNLYELGYRIWFDEGIEASAEWPEFIEDHLSRSAAVMAFVTDNFVKSHNCRKEITYALNQKIPLICVMPDKIDLGKGLALQLSDQQQFYLSSMSAEKFYEKLAESGTIESCRWKAADGTVVKKHKGLFSRKAKAKVKGPLKILLIAVTSIAVLFGGLVIHAFIFPEMWEEDVVDTTRQETNLWPNEVNHIWEKDESGALFCVGCGAQTGELAGEPQVLSGWWSEEKIGLGLTSSTYFVPVGTIKNCYKITMSMSVSDVEGDPFCEWALFMRDEEGVWSKVTVFDLTKEMENHSVDIPLEFAEPISFTGLFVGCNDSSADYTLNFDVIFKGVEIKE